MQFIFWHYSFGLKFYLYRYYSALSSVVHYFSLNLLIPTLFAPWKKLVISDNKKGFDIMEWLNVTSFNMVSRVIGAIVRIVLFFTGSIILLVILLFGSLGVFIWLLLPFISIGIYLRYTSSPEKILEYLNSSLVKNNKNWARFVFDSLPGRFLCSHLNINLEDMVANCKQINWDGKNFDYKNFESLINDLIELKAFEENFLNANSIRPEDIKLVAKWWDKRQTEDSEISLEVPSVKAGIGRELLFGYTPILDKFATELTQEKDFFHHLIGRKNSVDRIQRNLESGNSVVLMGEPGVGKKTVVLEFAKRAMYGELGHELSYRRIVELDLNFLSSESSDLNQKKQNLSDILSESSNAGNIILVVRDLHRYTNSSVEGLDFTDIFEKYLEKRKLLLIALSSKVEYERFIEPNIRLRKFLETVEVLEPTLEEAMEIAIEAAENWEKIENIFISVPALRKLLNSSDKYITDTPFPEKVLEMLDAAVSYHNQNGNSKILGVKEAEIVISERTGVPQEALSDDRKKKLANLEEIIKERLVDQDEAVDLIAKIIRSKASGVVNNNRPIGSFLFLGPTGVGKTETAKVLAKVYFGSEKNIIRFDMSEYSSREGLERLIGSQFNNQPGSLTTAIRERPASLLLLDEIEKASPQIFNLFLALLDEGKITDAFGKTVNASNLFVIATSNAGANYIRELVNSNDLSDLQKKVTDKVMKDGLFSPEFINRFDGVVVYKPLSISAIESIVKIMIKELVMGLKLNKNIEINFSEDAIKKLVKDGYEPEFGARPMRRLLDLEIGDLIGKKLLSGELKSGDKAQIVADSDNFSINKE